MVAPQLTIATAESTEERLRQLSMSYRHLLAQAVQQAPGQRLVVPKRLVIEPLPEIVIENSIDGRETIVRVVSPVENCPKCEGTGHLRDGQPVQVPPGWKPEREA